MKRIPQKISISQSEIFSDPAYALEKISKDPEVDMLIAAFIDGIQNSIKYLRGNWSEDYKEDHDWFTDQITEDTFSFNWYCTIFNISPIHWRDKIFKYAQLTNTT